MQIREENEEGLAKAWENTHVSRGSRRLRGSLFAEANTPYRKRNTPLAVQTVLYTQQ